MNTVPLFMFFLHYSVPLLCSRSNVPLRRGERKEKRIRIDSESVVCTLSSLSFAYRLSSGSRVLRLQSNSSLSSHVRQLKVAGERERGRGRLTRSLLGSAPTTFPTSTPPLKNKNVGIAYSPLCQLAVLREREKGQGKGEGTDLDSNLSCDLL